MSEENNESITLADPITIEPASGAATTDVPAAGPVPGPAAPNTTLTGLTEAEVRERFARGEINRTGPGTGKSVREIILGHLFTYFNGIFAVLAVLLIIAGSFRNLTFLPVVIGNTLIGIFQELRAKKILDELSVLSQSKAKVLRDGTETEIPIDRLVKGDVVHLTAGAQIMADAQLLEGELSVNESLVTGEADEIPKTPAAGENDLRSGSFVVSGSAYARLVRVGADSYVSRLTAKARQIHRHDKSEMVRAIDLLVLIAGIAILPVGITLFVQSYVVQKLSFADSVTSMVAAVIGMIPEGLYLLVSVALALSSMRLARQQVLLHDMRSVETLARVDVLCVDKTGTITDNTMKVADFVAPEGTDPEALSATASILAGYLMALPDDNATMQALRVYFDKGQALTPTATHPFTSRNKYSQVDVKGTSYRLGAPDVILAGSVLEEAKELIEYYAGRGERVVAFAAREDTAKDAAYRPLAFIVLRNSLRKNVGKVFAQLQEQEVEIKVISGDHPLAVSRIAAGVGIKGAERYIDASTLGSREELEEAVTKYVVFGRVKPEMKREIVRAIRRQGRKVAMTGDGVNDILAMKEADCSIAMGAGTDAARQAAQVVLMDSDFGRMRQIIGEGRRDINNIARSATLFIYKNIFSLLMALFSIVRLMEYPLEPSQVSLISGFNIGIPAFFLALEPNEKKQQPRFLERVLLRALPAAITAFLIIGAMVIFGEVFGVSAEDVSVASTFLLAIVGFMILTKISAPINRYRLAVIAGCALGMILTAVVLSDLFAITLPSTQCFMLFGVFAIAEEPFMRYLTQLFAHIESLHLGDRIARWKKKHRPEA